ncbi:MAG: preprotein translocase subunit SecG [Patescibacteria group bacterium]
MKSILLLVIIPLSILIVIFILMQGKGAGLGSAWGGGGDLYQTRRGIEKITLQVTVGLIIAFLVLSVVNLFIQ